MAQPLAAAPLVCDVMVGCPCFALSAATCFADEPDWRFTAVGDTAQNAKRSLDRHRHLHELHADRAEELKLLAAKFTRHENGFRCTVCAKGLSEMKFVLSHRCRLQPGPSKRAVVRTRAKRAKVPKVRLVPKRRFCTLTPKRLRGKTKVAPAAVDMAAAISLPRDLAYSQVAQDIVAARGSSATLMHVNASSVFNAARLHTILDAMRVAWAPGATVGMFVQLPEHSGYAAFVSVDGPSEVTVLRYQRVAGEGCPVHAKEEAGDCWCIARPLRSEKLQLSPEMFCEDILVPRAGLRSHNHGPEKPWHRCYRVASRAPSITHVPSSATDELLASAAATLLDSDGEQDLMTTTCSRIFEDVAAKKTFLYSRRRPTWRAESLP